MALLWLLIVAALATFIVQTGFVYLATAQRLLKKGILPLDMKLIAYIWLIVGYPSDVLFNWTRGTWMLRELPKEFLFTSRIQRHVDEGDLSEKVILWARILNEIDPGHIKRLPSWAVK